MPTEIAPQAPGTAAAAATPIIGAAPLIDDPRSPVTFKPPVNWISEPISATDAKDHFVGKWSANVATTAGLMTQNINIIASAYSGTVEKLKNDGVFTLHLNPALATSTEPRAAMLCGTTPTYIVVRTINVLKHTVVVEQLAVVVAGVRYTATLTQDVADKPGPEGQEALESLCVRPPVP